LCWENVTTERTFSLSSHPVPERAKCLTSIVAGKLRLISSWVYRPVRQRVSTYCETSVAVILTARSGAASSKAIAMLNDSWPVEHAADHTRTDASSGGPAPAPG